MINAPWKTFGSRYRIALDFFYKLLVIYLFPLLINCTSDKNNIDLQILFLSNINGNIENCGCGEPSLGGMDRIMTIVNNMRAQNSDLVFIDGGDFCNPYPYPELNRTVLKIYKQLNPDILIAGDQEFRESSEFSTGFFESFASSILATNIDYNGIDLHRVKIFNTKHGVSFIFLSYLSKKSFFPVKTENQFLQFKEYLFRENYAKYKYKGFLTVIYHGSLSELETFVLNYPEIDLILLGHTQSYIKLKNGQPHKIGGGADGENLINIEIREKDGAFNFDISNIPITKETIPDKTINEFISNFKEKTIKNAKN